MPKHQLQVIVDYSPGDAYVRLTFSYPFSGEHELKPRSLEIDLDEVPEARRAALDTLVEAAGTRIPKPTPVRLPHATVVPDVRRTVATLVIQDQTQPYPVLRQLYLEEHPALGFSKEREVRLDREDFSSQETATFRIFAEWAKGVAWSEYVKLVPDELHP